ncbi:maleylpyruvate isomerase family mycothiol-dependent enzyme [Streptomyces sp. NPDC053429]|uniref:maleylpyruvate isomerase family mycothiol-dependent enzyme n=1 Tax=Streptomyces sp. NPDC053429 TaxID=3365702 RepID=UPI0037D7F807
MDEITRLNLFHAQARAFEKAVRRAVGPGGRPPLVPSCPGWSVSDLVGHLGGVHRYLAHILRRRLTEAPDPSDLSLYGLPSDPADLAAWPRPDRTPTLDPVPGSLIDWFAEGAATLAELLRTLGPDVPVWTWSSERTSGFWLRMQLIELTLHRWDAEAVTGTPDPVDARVAADAMPHTFEVMAPARRLWKPAPPGAGERYRFLRTDAAGSWTVTFAGDQVLSEPGATGPVDVEAAGTASELMLFLWQRLPASTLTVTGDPGRLDRYFELVPPV